MIDLKREHFTLTIIYSFVFISLVLFLHFFALYAAREAFFKENIQAGVLQRDRLEVFEQNFTQTLFPFEAALIICAVCGAYILSKNTLQPIAAMMKRQEDFIADASHEFRVPLTAIKRSLELLERDEKTLSKEYHDTFLQIRDEVVRMDQLVNGLLTFINSGDKRRNHHWSLVPLHEILNECFASMNEAAKAKLLIFTHEPFEEVFVEGERDKIKQLVLILLDNAIKYTPNAGRVHVSLVKSQHRIQIVITDSGHGIPQEETKNIFDRFYRIKEYAKVVKGNGLGLSIAKTIVDHHRGTISVASDVMKGSTFIVTLPRN